MPGEDAALLSPLFSFFLLFCFAEAVNADLSSSFT